MQVPGGLLLRPSLLSFTHGTMSRMASPTARRKFGIELRSLREEADLTIEEVSDATGISMSHLSRIERGRSGVRRPTLMALLQQYGADPATTERLVEAAAETTKRKDRDWWQPYAASISDKYATLMAFESEASAIRTFHPIIVPGLLQTEEYARASLQRGTVRLTPDEIETRVEARRARQAVLDKPDPPQAWFILDEATVRRPVGGTEVMRSQLRHLTEMSARPGVDIQVIPFAVGAHAGTLGPLVILGFTEGENVVYCETYAADLYPEAVGLYGDVFDRLAQDALSIERSVRLIKRVAEEMK